MANEISSRLIKFMDEQVDFGSQISRALIQDIAAALNGFCEFSDVMCTELNGSGTYTTKDKSSFLVAVGVGGGGGGGGGGNGGVLDWIGTVTTMENASGGSIPNVPGPYYYIWQSKGTRGFDGQNGEDTTFNGVTIAPGGIAGKGAHYMRPFWEIYPQPQSQPQNQVFGQEEVIVRYQNKYVYVALNCRDANSIGGANVGGGGFGGLGTPSRINGTFPAHTGGETDTFGGMRGHYGQPGELCWACVDVEPGTTYDYSVGQGGAGGQGGVTYSISFNGGILNKSNNFVAGNGQPGRLIIFEFGF